MNGLGGKAGISGPSSSICKDLIDEINADSTRGRLPPTQFTQSTVSMHFYDSIVVFERGVYPDKRSIITGNPQTY